MARKILIVDDNAINRQMLINTLHKDYDIIEAENGQEAITLMHRNFKILSAVLLDIVMPEMDGYEVLRVVKENMQLAQVPVIMVTGSEDEESKVRALALGANDFILKPFNPDIVKHCLRNNIAMRETASILNAIQKDKLTGLYNRETFFAKVTVTIKGREPGYYVLSCFDIDSFKLINDQYGAEVGDSILKEIGVVVKNNIDEINGIAARISADNFAALYPASNNEASVLRGIQDKKLVSLERQSVVFSVGCYLITDLTLPGSAIYDRAYIAKQSVKGRYDKHIAYFDEEMLVKLVRDQHIIGEMEEALVAGQFEVWFQPQYNHATGALIGAEALTRWRHPERGIIPPGEFVPLFEQNGFVYEMDKYVWHEVCRYLRKWIDKGYEPLPASVNISRYDIFRADLVEVITGYVREFNIPIDLLRLEITESAFAKSTKMIVDIVKKFIALGFTIEIDDFGSGYSSLNTLKSVPAQVVKLDMRFLEGDEDIQRGGNILESIVRMTKWLGMSVIAEGVETREQGDFLKSIGCSHVQGFLYARPMPPEEYEAHFRDAQAEERLLTLETVENLDNDMFWNPQSMDTLIFNSYVGAACIFEYHNGGLELLRATDKFARMLCGEGMTVDDVLKIDVMKYLDKKTAAVTLSSVDASTRSKGETIGEFLFLDLPGCPHETYLRSTMRVIASTRDRYLIYCISENTTAQRISERKEREVTKQLKALIDNINCGITAVAVSGDEVSFLLSNDKYYELLGYTRQQYEREIGGEAFGFVYPDDKDRVTEILAHTEKTGEPTSLEYRAVCRDGTVMWLRSFVSITSFEEVEGQVQLCTYADITAEKHAAEELLDNLPGGAALYEYSDGELSIIHLNKQYLTLVDRAVVSYADLSVLGAVYPDDRSTICEEVASAIRQNRDAVCDIRVKTGKGSYRPFHVVGRLVPKGEGKYAVYAFYTPITDEAMSIQEMLPVALTAVMSTSPDMSFVKDKDLRYICCSKAFANMVGLESERDVVGKSDYDLFSKDFADRYVTDDRQLIESGKSIIDMVENIPSEDGKNRFSSTSKYLLYDSRGNVVGLFGSGRDVTQAKEAESQQQFIINSIPGGVAVFEGIWSTLDSIKLTYFSDGYCRLFGYTRDEYEKLSSKSPISLVYQEYLPELVSQIEALVRNSSPIDCIYKARVKNGGHKWIHIKAVEGGRHGENMTVNAVLFDVTERQEALENLRVSEEENRLAIRNSGNVVCRYDVGTRSLRVSPSVNPVFETPTVIEDVPYGQVRDGRISPETASDYISLYESVIKGETNYDATYQRKSTIGWRWIEAHSSTIYSSDGEPVSAVISFADATDRYEKDAAYQKWLQSLQNKEPEDYSLFRCNVSKNSIISGSEGHLLSIRYDAGSFDEYTAEYCGRFVEDEDEGRFAAFLNVDALLEKYYRGERILTLEYREKLQDGQNRWLKLTVDLVEYPHSADIEAYLLFENIDEAKRTELLTIERAETDPLTGILNRTTFAERVNAMIAASKPQSKHALLMLDIDGFKRVNDVFGHGAGDQTLIDIANLLETVLRRDDLVGRLGGDEFVVFLNNIPEEIIAAHKAKQICDLTRKAYGDEVRISGSVGIAMCPIDGRNFDTLYKKADETLYHVKKSGKNNYAFYRENLKDEPKRAKTGVQVLATSAKRDNKRRMLIVDDNMLDYELLANMFKDEFIIEKAKDGEAALVSLWYYGSAISVVLLDLMMPGIDGFEVLEKMQNNAEMRSIPVVVVSGDENRETSLKAIRRGASDFVIKPVDADVLRIRVLSAISKAENERLRAKNSYLELQSTETARYKTLLAQSGFAIVELDWIKNAFTYCTPMNDYLAGNYDDRTMWHVMLTDGVADAQTVMDIQKLVLSVANEKHAAEGHISARLKAACGKNHLFRVNVSRIMNGKGLTESIIITFCDIDAQEESR